MRISKFLESTNMWKVRTGRRHELVDCGLNSATNSTWYLAVQVRAQLCISEPCPVARHEMLRKPNCTANDETLVTGSARTLPYHALASQVHSKRGQVWHGIVSWEMERALKVANKSLRQVHCCVGSCVHSAPSIMALSFWLPCIKCQVENNPPQLLRHSSRRVSN